MIDRKALWIAIAVIAVMFAASVWRFSLLPDWHQMPADGPGSRHTVNGLVLFIEPAALLFVAARLFARKWLASGPEEAVRPWEKWSARMLLPFAGLASLIQAFMIARSLGLGLGLDRSVVACSILVMSGLLLMMLGNGMPKLPWLARRIALFRLDAWQENRRLRFEGRLMVGLGLLIAAGGPLLLSAQPKWFAPVFFSLCLGMLAACIAYRIKLRREPSPQ